eukprot:CAMPEP_0196804202 /NCGR_PEP_ID=MMETSP1362-20130617/3752_1 /TAXON_ID=163516 /ORGANISM="Leptocylindrus danicus, Strain CCMP1856" /LENGTH=183 /DNA_ID=CAMNT_0042176325 /DNA_START=144 /DNA_END=695 /DNA_ORIENTATION=+
MSFVALFTVLPILRSLLDDASRSSREWNWGSAIGTGHDCALICRNKWSNQETRQNLIDALVADNDDTFSALLDDDSLDELKLILGLCWQRGRWDGTDGGRGGYGEVLNYMAECKYETWFDCDDGTAAKRELLSDMSERFHLISKSEDETASIMELKDDDDIDASVRKCAGHVLNKMEFVVSGL